MAHFGMRHGTRLWCAPALLLLAAPAFAYAQMPAGITAQQLAREVFYNEVQDHQRHGFWRYSVQMVTAGESRLLDQVETTSGPVNRLVRTNDKPLDPGQLRTEQQRLNDLLASPSQQAHLHQQYQADEDRMARVMKMMPDAFLYEYAGEENGEVHLRFHPNPDYPTRTIEAKVVYAMDGDLWVDAKLKRLRRVEGRLENNVDFGWGLLGHLNKGGWARVERGPADASQWKTTNFEIHLTGTAVLFHTISRDTSERRFDFVQLPSAPSLAQGVDMLRSALLAEMKGNGAPGTAANGTTARNSTRQANPRAPVH